LDDFEDRPGLSVLFLSFGAGPRRRGAFPGRGVSHVFRQGVHEFFRDGDALLQSALSEDLLEASAQMISSKFGWLLRAGEDDVEARVEGFGGFEPHFQHGVRKELWRGRFRAEGRHLEEGLIEGFVADAEGQFPLGFAGGRQIGLPERDDAVFGDAILCDPLQGFPEVF
jgi:hypothetical protein